MRLWRPHSDRLTPSLRVPRAPGVQDEMTHRNAQFLSMIEPLAKAHILGAIVEHYGITPDQAFDEIAGQDAEHLLDYMVEPHRGAASVLMQRHGMR